MEFVDCFGNRITICSFVIFFSLPKQKEKMGQRQVREPQPVQYRQDKGGALSFDPEVQFIRAQPSKSIRKPRMPPPNRPTQQQLAQLRARYEVPLFEVEPMFEEVDLGTSIPLSIRGGPFQVAQLSQPQIELVQSVQRGQPELGYVSIRPQSVSIKPKSIREQIRKGHVQSLRRRFGG